MTMPDWRRFSRLPFTVEVHAAIMALAIEVPPQGRPTLFHGSSSMLAISRQDGPDGARFKVWDSSCQGNRWLFTAREVFTESELIEGTPQGDALRQWLTWWDCDPVEEQQRLHD